MSAMKHTEPVPAESTSGEQPFLSTKRTARVLFWLVALLATLSMLLFLVSAWPRLHFPYDLIDTGMLLEVQRVHGGLPLYGPPTVEFTPFLYAPIYIYAASAMAHFTGVNYESLRLVSTLATMGCFGLLYALVFAETRRHFAGVVAAGLFAACYPVAMQWFDMGRVDMLFLFLVLGALYATRWWNPALAAVLWVAAFQTKQGVLPIAVLALCHDWRRPRRVLLGLGVFGGLLWGSIQWMNHATAGWYSYYLFHLVNGFGYNKHVGARFLTDDLLGVYGIAVLVVLAALLVRPVRWSSRATSFYAINCIGMIVFTAYVRAHRGAALNAVLPAYAWISVMAGLGLSRLLEWLDTLDESWQHPAKVVLMAAMIVQFAMHAYSPREFRPKPVDYAHREAFQKQLRQIPGDVLVTTHPEDAVFAGKATYAQIDATGSVIDASSHVLGDQLIAEYARLIHTTHFDAVAVDHTLAEMRRSERTWLPMDFEKFYPLQIVISTEEDVDLKLGSQPQTIYMPCRLAATAKALDPGLDVARCAASALRN